MITIIVAYDENRVIGNNGSIPWHIPEDAKHFKEVTTGNCCIMGRKTWDSLPARYKPLPNRFNWVITSQPDEFIGNQAELWVSLCDLAMTMDDAMGASSSLESALNWCKSKYSEIFIIGGSQIYQYALDHHLADRILASEIKGKYEGDTFFPKVEATGILLKEYKDFNLVEYKL